MSASKTNTFLLDNGYAGYMETITNMLDQWHWNWAKIQRDANSAGSVAGFLERWNDRLEKALMVLTQEELMDVLGLFDQELDNMAMLAGCLHMDWVEDAPASLPALPDSLARTRSLLSEFDRLANGQPLQVVSRNEDALQARVDAEYAKLYESGWRADVFGGKVGDAEAAAEDRRVMKQYGRKDGDTKRTVALDFGMYDATEWHCPACGRKLFDFDTAKVDMCRHALIACVNGAEIGVNDVGGDMIQGKRPDLVPSEVFKKEGGATPGDVIKAAYATGTNFILSETAGAMACGPVWNTVEILFECKDEVLAKPA